MSAFDERGRAFEAKYHLDEEIAFKVNARRDKLIGLWAAEQLGLSGDEAEAYAKSLVDIDITDPVHKTMFKKLHADLSAKHADISEERVNMKMAKLYEIAYKEIVHDVAGGKLTISPE